MNVYKWAILYKIYLRAQRVQWQLGNAFSNYLLARKASLELEITVKYCNNYITYFLIGDTQTKRILNMYSCTLATPCEEESNNWSPNSIGLRELLKIIPMTHFGQTKLA